MSLNYSQQNIKNNTDICVIENIISLTKGTVDIDII